MLRSLKNNYPRINLGIYTAFILLFIYFYLSDKSPHTLFILTGTILAYSIMGNRIMARILSQQEALINDLQEQTDTDTLTGLKNIKCFRSHIEEELKRTKEAATCLGLAILDIDAFKKYNINYGYITGDKILKQVANFLKRNILPGESLARLGGDKFVLFLPKNLPEEVLETTHQLQYQLKTAEFEVENQKIKLEISAGVSFYPEDGQTFDELLRVAEKYLRKAKQTGGKVYSSHDNLPRLDIHKSINIYPDNIYLDKIAKRSTQLNLLYKEKNIEIIKQIIDENKRFIIEAAEGWPGFEFFFILKGKVLQVKQNRVLNEGYYITTNHLKKQIHFKTITPVTLLYITNIPIFAQQYDKIEKMAKMIAEVSSKDQRTESHAFRIQEMALKIGEAIGLEDDKLFSLIYAAYLHDVGKIKVPTQILQKKGSLDKSEWEFIENHPIWGRDIILEQLQGSNADNVAEIVYQHHENYDGTGYPQGLKGNQIKLEAQILSLLDTYDAITSDRPYQKARSKGEALQEIKRCSGTKFNPEVVGHFLQIVNSLLEM